MDNTIDTMDNAEKLNNARIMALNCEVGELMNKYNVSDKIDANFFEIQFRIKELYKEKRAKILDQCFLEAMEEILGADTSTDGTNGSHDGAKGTD